MNIILNLNKPQGLSSQQAVTKVKKLLGVKKAGHTGTLDPIATGVLIVCLNEATKISRFLLNLDKTYNATLKLGERTDTLDAEGKITETRVVPDISMSDLDAVMNRFTGRIKQKPPMYSAIKIKGQPLYKIARKGIEMERDERQVTVHSFRILNVDLPHITISVSCSKGTYIRTLCDDIGLSLGTVAHLVSLERTSVGQFSIENAVTLSELEHGIADGMPFVCGIDSAISSVPEIILPENEYIRAKHGMSLTREISDEMPRDSYLRLKNPDGILFGIGRVEDSKIVIERNLNI